MHTSLIAMIAPSGCYSTSHNVAFVQRESQGCHKEPRINTEIDQRKQLLRKILASEGLTPAIRASIECYMYAHSTITSWHLLRDERKTAVVRQLYDDVRRTARVQHEMMTKTSSNFAVNLPLEAKRS